MLPSPRGQDDRWLCVRRLAPDNSNLGAVTFIANTRVRFTKDLGEDTESIVNA